MSLGLVRLRWCECKHLTLMRTTSAGRDLPEELVSVCFQTNPGMVRLMDATGTRSAACTMRIIVWVAVTPRLAAHCRTVGWKWVIAQHGAKRRRNVAYIGCLNRQPHKTYAWKHTEKCLCTSTPGWGRRSSTGKQMYETNQYQHNECPLDVHENVGLLTPTLPLTFLSLPVYPAPDFFVQWFNDLCTHVRCWQIPKLLRLQCEKQPHQTKNI